MMIPYKKLQQLTMIFTDPITTIHKDLLHKFVFINLAKWLFVPNVTTDYLIKV